MQLLLLVCSVFEEFTIFFCQALENSGLNMSGPFLSKSCLRCWVVYHTIITMNCVIQGTKYPQGWTLHLYYKALMVKTFCFRSYCINFSSCSVSVSMSSFAPPFHTIAYTTLSPAHNLFLMQLLFLIFLVYHSGKKEGEGAYQDPLYRVGGI